MKLAFSGLPLIIVTFLMYYTIVSNIPDESELACMRALAAPPGSAKNISVNIQ